MLKIKIILFVVTGLLTIQGFTQEFNAGIYGGIVASQLDGDTYGGYNKAGLVTGGFVNRFLNKKLAGQMGLRYIQKGSKEANDEIQSYYKAQLHYVEMPLTLRYFHFKKVDFEAGLAVAYLVKGLEAVNNDLYLEEANPAFDDFDYSVLLGLSYQFTDKISVGAQFSYSLLAIRPYFSGLSYVKGGQYNNLLQFSLAYNLSTWR